MPAMSAVERLFCQSSAWGWFAGRLVLRWALQGRPLRGDVLELGAGGGAMAKETMRQFPAARLTLTDVDPAMLAALSRRLGRVQGAPLVTADATALPFVDGSFDVVTSYLMLHHVIDWEAAVAEAGRVLRPGGLLVGYDLVETRLTEWLHWADGSPHRLMRRGQLEGALADAGLETTSVRYDGWYQVVRFAARKPS
ncbi:SAM-dependent methyltransferase [Blastococcus sp. TF02-8]|uniref:class I SAM-dependent methyltransferase n=1 Tax=Blastococcus sp. TF02-8 TaxID=2250574 RepID=UPI000DE82AD6|nr:class I SAM-dependent methyltransferase [Blastococcus sp. TF02-8]RBY97546.1 SAM-dependent methyltransferase [Blastococcus sp. TF02-8]